MKVNHKKRSNAAINSWQDPMTRANHMAGKERTGRSKSEEEKHRCEILAKAGYNIIIVWEDELLNTALLRRRLLKLLRGVE